ncbi:MAG: MBL fold metallo-hydrolase [Deltaproteobacteria bacterium]
MLQSNTWTRVPGTFEVDIYPIIRKPSIVCSSTFILKSPENIVIIDPGGDRFQFEQIRHVVMQLLSEKKLPVFIFITHCHHDHFLVATQLSDEQIKGRFICHPKAARSIESKDRAATGADMTDTILPNTTIHMILPHISGQHMIEIPGNNNHLVMQPFNMGGQDVMEIYHTPGHSPDGLCYRVGRLLFTGDIHLATTPGIVGLVGWDSAALLATLNALIHIGRIHAIETFLPGHGIPFPFEKAERILDSVKKEAVRLSGIVRMDKTRADYISEYAIVLLEEASNIFSIVSGHLLKISYYLEMLEEAANASEIAGSIDTEAIDKAVDEFYYFTKELKGGGIPLIARAVQFVKSIEKVFAPDKVKHLFHANLLRRLRNLLSDFINVAYGVYFDNQETVFDINQSIQELLVTLVENPHESESIFESLENDEVYMKELIRRIAFEPLFSSMQFDFVSAKGAIVVVADNYTFHDTVSALLEQFAVSGIKHVYLKSLIKEGNVVLQVTDGTKDSTLELRDSKLSYLGHSMRLAGGGFHRTSIDDIIYYDFELPLAKTVKRGDKRAGGLEG